MRFLTCTALLLLALAPGSHQTADARRPGSASAAIAEADMLGRALHQASGVPAMTIAVRRGEALLWSAAYGTPSLEIPRGLDADARMRAGSVSKLFTVAALMRAWDRGAIDLDAPVQQYVPAFAHQPAITIRQLAGHLGGIRHYREGDRALTLRHFDSVEDSVKIVAGDALVHPPGSKYLYSSFGYNVLAAAIERASGEPFLDAVQHLVFDPLALNHSGPDRVDAILVGRVAPYQREKSGIRNAAFVDPSYKWAGGGFLTTVLDLTRFGAAHLRDGFLSTAARTQMFAPQATADGALTNVGIGWRIGKDWRGRPILHHAGSQEGARSVLVLYPDEQLSIAIMTNLFGEPALIETSAAAIAEPFLRDATERARLGEGSFVVTGESPQGAFTGRIDVARDAAGVVTARLTGFAPLMKFGSAVGVAASDTMPAPLVVPRDGGAVMFVLTPFGYVPVEVRQEAGGISGRSLVPGGPLVFSFRGSQPAPR